MGGVNPVKPNRASGSEADDAPFARAVSLSGSEADDLPFATEVPGSSASGHHNGRHVREVPSPPVAYAAPNRREESPLFINPLPITVPPVPFERLQKTNFPYHRNEALRRINPKDAPEELNFKRNGTKAESDLIYSKRKQWFQNKGLSEDEARDACRTDYEIFSESVVKVQNRTNDSAWNDLRFIRHQWLENSFINFTGHTTAINVTLDLVPTAVRKTQINWLLL